MKLSKADVLVISSLKTLGLDFELAYLLREDKFEDASISFELGETLTSSCSLTFKNELYIFGLSRGRAWSTKMNFK